MEQILPDQNQIGEGFAEKTGGSKEKHNSEAIKLGVLLAAIDNEVSPEQRNEILTQMALTEMARIEMVQSGTEKAKERVKQAIEGNKPKMYGLIEDCMRPYWVKLGIEEWSSDAVKIDEGDDELTKRTKEEYNRLVTLADSFVSGGESVPPAIDKTRFGVEQST